MTSQELRVSWLPGPQDVSESKTEDLADVVFRLLLGHPKSWTTAGLECLPQPPKNNIPKDHFFDIRRQLKALSWREKLQGWQRVVSPITNKPDEEESPVPLNLVDSASLPEHKPDERGFRSITTATFGHVLHNTPEAAQNDDLDQPRGPTPVPVLAKKPRTFSPLIPHPASFSALKPEGSEPLTQSTTIILNLAVDSTSTKRSPVVQVRLPVDNEADLDNFSIPTATTAYNLVSWYRSDLLLPGESVDVRIQHQRLLPLDLDESKVRSFLEASEFNLLQGHLRTPSQITLRIPSLHISTTGKASSKTKARVYTFRGLEIHQTVEIPWRGHTLRYSSIEAGQHGGQRQELTLQAGSPGDPDAGFEGEKRKTFLQLVEDMATGKCFSWTQGYESIKSRQLEDHSYDLPEEELTQDIIVENDKFDKYGRPNLQRYEEPRKPRTRRMQRREAVRAPPPRPRKLDHLGKTKRFKGADEPGVTEPKAEESEVGNEVEESEGDRASASGPDSTAPEAKELETKEPELDQTGVDKSDVAVEEIKEPEAKESKAKEPEAKEPEIKEPEVKEPEASQTSAKKPQQGQQRGAKPQSTTDLLHSFLDQFSDPMSLKPPTVQRAAQPRPDIVTLSKPMVQKEAAKPMIQEETVKPKDRQPQKAAKPAKAVKAAAPRPREAAPEARRRASASSDVDPFSAKFSARAVDKPPAAAAPSSAAAKKSKKGDSPGNRNRNRRQQQAATAAANPPSHSSQFKDPFAAAFANRLSTTALHSSSSGGGGFFDDLPKPQATKKKKGAAWWKWKRR